MICAGRRPLPLLALGVVMLAMPGNVVARGRSDPGSMMERAARAWFGAHFEPLATEPAEIIGRDSDYPVREFVREWHGICRDELGERDEFAIHDCRKRIEALRSRGAPRHLLLVTSWAKSFRYDFHRRAWVIVFTDELLFGSHCEEPGVSVWRPRMPDAIKVTCVRANAPA